MLHHLAEILIRIDRAAHTLVVFAEFVKRNDSIFFLRVPLAQEFSEDVIFGLAALDYVRVGA